jgi:glycosyltransferase involved in cell wall biosynthesis
MRQSHRADKWRLPSEEQSAGLEGGEKPAAKGTEERMNISVILCTYNRCQSLAKALDSLAASILPEDTEWEILVVDNKSKDQTWEVVEGFCQRYPGRFRYLFELRQGKSFALNSALREARGDILVFVDDDVKVEPTWLHELTASLHNGEWAGSGGRILPEPGFSPPRWLALDGPRNLGMVLCAQFDLGNVPGELKDAPFGTNMAFRREMFDKYGGFRGDLGPRPSETRNEDTEFGRRLMAGGERLRYVPSAVVYHEVHESRVRKQFFLTWWFDHGRGDIRETGKTLRAREIVKLLGSTLRTALGSVLSFDQERRFYRRCMVWHAAGKLVEARRQSKESGYKTKRQPESV